VLQGGVVKEVALGQGRLAQRPALRVLERAVQVQHHVAEHVPQQQHPQEIVPEELDERRI